MLSLRVTSGDVFVGVARFSAANGLAHGLLEPTSDYLRVAGAAQRLARELTATRWWRDAARDFAAEFALRWDAATLALEDLSGRRIPACSVVLLETASGATAAPSVRVVADLRSDCAQRAVRTAVSYKRSA